MSHLYADIVSHAITDLGITVDESGSVVGLDFLPAGQSNNNGRQELTRRVEARGDRLTWDPARCAGVARQLREYFAGERRDFDLPLAPPGSGFQQKVWQELSRIPYGTTISYAELARRTGNPKASRAVGRANATNPIPVVIPCHRVIGADGSLTGFGGGLPVKQALLELEGVAAGQ
ncbi:MAG TPA: methylated-DNA--[protein]-cysteine S-methyltransferase, partial [Thermoanaerobaculia bacterium]|nr:methylated-DNA--[protein]-cysteine S-methyltransferase [Thermoanaerobaculia bacterium]